MKVIGQRGRALIVAPHPDDEVIGTAVLIDKMMHRGMSVNVIIVSDGAASHLQSSNWPRQRLIAERRRESLRALSRLRVPRHRVMFLDLPDSALIEPHADCTRTLHWAIGRLGSLQFIAGPSPDDAHPDHRAVGLALQAWRSPAKLLVYSVWPPTSRCRGPLMKCVGPSYAWKRSLIAGYRTQMGAIRDDPQGFAIAPHELRRFARPIELFERVAR